MKDYRNFVLINNGKRLASTFYANCSSDASINVHYGITNIHMLKLINSHLENIKEWKENDKAINVYYLLIPPKLCKLIKDKTFKTLMNSDKISLAERLQWKRFDGLYKEVFADIIFKPNNTYDSNNINKAYKHIVYTKKLIDKMYRLLDSIEDNANSINNY